MFEYRWFKVGADIFNDTKIKIIEADEEADTIICIWFKALSLAGIVNDSGYLYINEETPYKLKTLAIEFNRPLEKVKAAMKVLIKLHFICKEIKVTPSFEGLKCFEKFYEWECGRNV